VVEPHIQNLLFSPSFPPKKLQLLYKTFSSIFLSFRDIHMGRLKCPTLYIWNIYICTWIWYNSFLFELLKTTSIWVRIKRPIKRPINTKILSLGFLRSTWILFFNNNYVFSCRDDRMKLGTIYWLQIFYTNNIRIIWTK